MHGTACNVWSHLHLHRSAVVRLGAAWQVGNALKTPRRAPEANALAPAARHLIASHAAPSPAIIGICRFNALIMQLPIHLSSSHHRSTTTLERTVSLSSSLFIISRTYAPQPPLPPTPPAPPHHHGRNSARSAMALQPAKTPEALARARTPRQTPCPSSGTARNSKTRWCPQDER